MYYLTGTVLAIPCLGARANWSSTVGNPQAMAAMRQQQQQLLHQQQARQLMAQQAFQANMQGGMPMNMAQFSQLNPQQIHQLRRGMGGPVSNIDTQAATSRVSG
jgi:hypothetical protein